MKKKVNVLYIERVSCGEGVLEEYKEFIESVFKSLNYEANVVTYSKKPDRKEISSIIDNKNVDIIFCDITLGTEMGENVLGLMLIKELKNEHPEIMICGISGEDVGYRNTSYPKNLPSFDLFINKGMCNEEVYNNFIIDEIRRVFCANTEIEIVKVNLSEDDERFVNKPFFTRLLKLITFTTHESDSGTNVKTITLFPTSGGYSQSYVFKMCCQTANGEKVIYSALKCSKKEYAIQEINNYKNYVKWYLPYTWRPEILSYAIGKDYGMICYSFAYNADEAFSSITDKIKIGDYAKVDNAIERIFSTKTRKWYSEKNCHNVNEAIGRYYTNIYFQGRNRPHEYVEKFITKLGGHINKGKYYISGSSFPMAHKMFSDVVTRNYQACICHGDLNTNNILTSDESNGLIFIDFQETKKGHVFHDFIVFEMCFRLYRETGFTFNKLLDIEIAISENNFEAIEDKNETYEQIKKLRGLAKENFPDENFKTYHYGMAMRAFRLFRNHDKLEQWQCEALLAVMLSNLKLLF